MTDVSMTSQVQKPEKAGPPGLRLAQGARPLAPSHEHEVVPSFRNVGAVLADSHAGSSPAVQGSSPAVEADDPMFDPACEASDHQIVQSEQSDG